MTVLLLPLLNGDLIAVIAALDGDDFGVVASFLVGVTRRVAAVEANVRAEVELATDFRAASPFVVADARVVVVVVFVIVRAPIGLCTWKANVIIR